MSSTDIVPAKGELTRVAATSKHQPIEVNERSGGVQMLFRFPNGYGASLINHTGSYGNEIAVIEWDGGHYAITYATPVTDDVLPYLTPEEIEAALDRIAALPAKEIEQ